MKPADCRILVVDDDHIIRHLLRSILRNEGFNVMGEATSGEMALEMCKKLDPNLVLLDVNMSRMDGLQALQEIKAQHPAMKVLMISAMPTMDRVKFAQGMGADGFIVKPFNAAKILDTIISLT
ncbi:MAG: response regulator [Pseudomonadota bacterium]